MGRPPAQIELTGAEESDLKALARRGKTRQWLARRARIVLRAAKGLPTEAIAEQLGIREATVSKWRGRFAKQRLEGICDAPRTGRPRQISDSDIAHLISSTLEQKPKGSTHWSCRLLAKELGVSATMVHRVWKTFGLQPHRSTTFTLSTDPLFVEKVVD